MIWWSMPHEWYSHQTTTHSNGNSYQHYERHSQWGPKKGLQCRVKLDQSIMWDSPHDWGSIPLQYRMQWADNIAAIAPSTPQLALSATKNSVTWHPIPENLAPSGQPLENTQSPTLGSSTKANFPTQLADQQMEWSANWSNITCFKCGNPGHRRAECPCLKLGLRTATIRTKDSNEIRLEPTLQQVNEEGEGEPQNTEARNPQKSYKMTGSQSHPNITCGMMKQQKNKLHIDPAQLELHQKRIQPWRPWQHKLQLPQTRQLIWCITIRTNFTPDQRGHKRTTVPCQSTGKSIAWKPTACWTVEAKGCWYPPNSHKSGHKDICPRNTNCLTIGMQRQSFHNQLWNECKNQIQSYMAWQILQCSQCQILWHHLRNTIPKKTQHCPGLLKPRKHSYGK